ncbi:MAG: hypothetical protein AB7S26_13655 [Sandaracinaceae bacterium]
MEIGDARYRIDEVEVYLRDPAHPDPFVHGHTAQRPPGQFYFHRAGHGFRGGSFKGVDLTIGEGPDAIGGILIRAIHRAPDEAVVGPSRVVDALLAAGGWASVSALDEAIAATCGPDRRGAATRADAPLRITRAEPRDLEPLWTARVGLTLKRCTPRDGRPEFLLRRYRALASPQLPKGRAHTLVALIEMNLSDREVSRATGSPLAAVARARSAYRRGLDDPGFERLVPRRGEPDPAEHRATLARLAGAAPSYLHGAWARRFGPDTSPA